MPPERLLASTAENYDYKADVWSVGMMTHRLATGVRLYPSGLQPYDFYNYVNKHRKVVMPEGRNYRKSLIKLIRACLRFEKDDRPSFEELLQHEFLATVHIDEQRPFFGEYVRKFR